MKSGIHPQYNTVTVACACGNSFVTRSTLPQIRLEICSNCHPFYTGRQKLMDTAGRVERFAKRFAATGGKTIVKKAAVKKPLVEAKTVKKVNKVLRNAPKPTIVPKGAKPAPKAKAPAAKAPAAAK